MKHLLIIGALLLNSLGFSQNEPTEQSSIDKKYELHTLKITISVDSAEELKSELTTKNIKEFAEIAIGDETITFKLICNYKSSTKNMKYHKTYEVIGTTFKIEEFIKLIENTKASAIEDYKTFRSHE